MLLCLQPYELRICELRMIIRITQKGIDTLKIWDKKDTIFPNPIHLLSGLRDGKTHSSYYFETFKYADPTVSDCISILKKDELIKIYF